MPLLIEAVWRLFASVNYTIIESNNGLLPHRCQAIIWPNAGILLFGPPGSNLRDILIKICISYISYIWIDCDHLSSNTYIAYGQRQLTILHSFRWCIFIIDKVDELSTHSLIHCLYRKCIESYWSILVLVRAILTQDDFGKSMELLCIFNRWCVFGIQTCITPIMLLNISSVNWNRL